MKVKFERVDWPRSKPFRIAYETQTHARGIQVQLQEGDVVGRSEAYGIPYRGETQESMLDQLSALQIDIENGLTREELQAKVPAGGARNAIDCAMWDFRAKTTGMRAWTLCGLHNVRPLKTDITLGLDDAVATAATLATYRRFTTIKIKLDGIEDVARVSAIRDVRPDARLIVDANQSWSEDLFFDRVPQLAKLNVSLIEQPVAPGQDEFLRGYSSPIPICADESCQTTTCLPSLVGKYDYINIKLDKAGGLTESLNLVREGNARGFKLFVGCMGGSSLAMAPGFVVGQFCELVDLDGPLLLSDDVSTPIIYEGALMMPPDRKLWG